MDAMVKCEFELMFEDYQHSLEAHASSAIRAAQRRVTVLHIVSGLAYMVLILSSFYLNPPRDGRDLREDLADMLGRIGPILVPTMLIGVSLRLAAGAGRSKGWLIVAVSSVLLAVFIAGPQLLLLYGTPGASRLPSIYRAVYPAAGCLTVFTLTAFSIIRAKRQATNQMWLGQAQLHGMKSLSADEHEVTIHDPNRQFTFQWPAIVRILEANDLWLLYVGKLAYWPIPKRAMNAADAKVFRELLRNKVEKRISAFPVIPITQTQEA